MLINHIFIFSLWLSKKLTVNVADYGAAGQVLEKLPEGFTYVNSTLPERAVTVNGSKVSFLLMNEKSLSYTFKAPASAGTYQFAGLLRDINKTELPILHSSSSINVGSTYNGGSGGGAGGSPELQSNVKAKELSQASVIAGTHVKFSIPNGVTCIRYVEFDAKRLSEKLLLSSKCSMANPSWFRTCPKALFIRT